MDFLRAPERCRHVLVPDLGGAEYDRLGFAEYGQRMGWNIEHLRRGNFLAAWIGDGVDGPGKTTAAEIKSRAAQFIQTWLYFGVLAEVLGIPIRRQDHILTCHDEGGKVTTSLTSAGLMSHIETWITTTRGLPSDEREHRLNLCKDILNTSTHFLLDLRVSDRPSFLSFEADLTFTSLAYFLNSWLVKEDEKYNAIWVHNRSNSTLEKRLLGQHYCANLMERVSMSLGLPGLYYFSLLEKQPEGKNHSRCTKENCFANTVDESTYCTRHTKLCNTESCSFLHVSTTAFEVDNDIPTIQTILDARCIPLIDLSSVDLKPGYKTSQLPLLALSLSGSERKAFVAISHVWADGFGNTDRNALPRCALAAIRSRVRKLTNTFELRTKSLMWMDTLCVPTSPEQSRKAAILAMQKTYDMAEAVLVIDASLFTIDTPVLLEECLVRIMCSAWMSRLWTAQEAWSARRIMFQFKDRAVELNGLLWETKRLPKFDHARYLCYRAKAPLEAVYGLVLMPPHGKHGPTKSSLRGHIINTSRDFQPHLLLRMHWKHLRYRTTSHEKDIPVCVATLIGSDLASVVKADNVDDRTREVVVMISVWRQSLSLRGLPIHGRSI